MGENRENGEGGRTGKEKEGEQGWGRTGRDNRGREGELRDGGVEGGKTGWEIRDVGRTEGEQGGRKI